MPAADWWHVERNGGIVFVRERPRPCSNRLSAFRSIITACSCARGREGREGDSKELASGVAKESFTSRRR